MGDNRLREEILKPKNIKNSLTGINKEDIEKTGWTPKNASYFCDSLSQARSLHRVFSGGL